MLDYQKYIKEEDRKQKLVRQRIVDVLTKHGRMNVNLNSDTAVYVLTNEIITALEEKITYR